MVLGLRTKTRKSPLVQLEYIVHIQEIKPWPPSQSLRTLRAVLIQWDHGENSSGFTNQAVPSLGTGSGVGDGRIEFNESFKLPVTLMREVSNKGGDGDTYQKNCIEFNLYEPRRDKVAKGQLLASAVVDLAAYGVVKENLSLSVPVNCKRTYSNAVQPLLFIKIQPLEMSSSSRNGLMREASMERNRGESVSALMSEEYAEEAEVVSCTTDEDVSSHSSLAVASSAADSNGSSSPRNIKNETENGTVRDAKVEQVPHRFVGKSGEEQATESHLNTVGNSSRSLMDLPSDISWISKRIKSPILHSSTKIYEWEKEGTFSSSISKESSTELSRQTDGSGFTLLHDDKNASSTGAVDILMAGRKNPPLTGFQDNDTDDKKHGEERRVMEERGQKIEKEPQSDFSQVDSQQEVILETGSNIDKSNNGKSVRSSTEYSRSNGSTRSNHSLVVDTARAKVIRKETRSLLSDSRVQHLENRIKILEGELREAAAIEASLYSVVAEHGSSMNKVHAPARRLSRLYFHANKQNPKSGRATAAKAIVSGIVLVAKACGNDVPRLTFWLSNAIVLRVISNSHIPISVGRGNVKVEDKNGKKTLKLETFPSKSTRGAIEDNAGDWENPLRFVTALEKIESWIFSRIIESLWWQNFTPHMQPGAAKAIRRGMDSASSKLYKRTSSSMDQQQGNFSLELWKKAFRDACERICPVRAGRHECRCLPVLSRLIMEQLVARLDVAMFNAILRESADEIPTDPVADPISDAKVLPIPAGKASFGSGAQLKNAIGNWSRWLTDLSGIDDDDMLENGNPETAQNEEQRSRDTSPKPFHLLNSLSDLMMLPKDMLLSLAVRKEVCPAFGAPVIRRIINSFVPDEFCPDPIPRTVMEALNSEDPLDIEDDSIVNIPCEAAPIEYQTPSVASVLGETSCPKLKRSGSSLLKKSQTSDDELDELGSPLKAVFLDNHLQSSPSSGCRNTVRYQLLRELWRMDA